MKPYPFDKYGTSQIRVIQDTDCACEGDDAYAIAQALMIPKFDIRAITAANFLFMPDSVDRSYQSVLDLLDSMDLTGQVNVLKGSLPMKSPTDYEESDASRFIVEEALREDDRPLFVVCQGAITNLAIALKTCPAIAEKIQCIWIGGGAYPEGGYEFNLCNDITAARIVMESDMPLWQVPANVYAQMTVSLMTLYEKTYDCGKPGKYLFDQLMDFHKKMQDKYNGHPTGDGLAGPYVPIRLDKSRPDSYCNFATGEMWSLGDSCVIGLMMNSQPNDRIWIGAPKINDDGTYVLQPDNPRKIAVYQTINAPFILEDFFSRLKYQYK